MREPANHGPATRPVVAWLSLAFGYGTDLMYFRRLFQGLVARFPGTIIPIDTVYPVDRYPELPLLPILTFIDVRQRRRRAGGSAYATAARLLTPASVIRLARRHPDVLVVTEFSAVSLAGWSLAKFRRLPIVLLVESDPSFRGAPSSRLVTAVKAWVANHCDAVLVSNRIGADYLLNTLGVREELVRIGPYLASDPAGEVVGGAQRSGPVRLLFLNSLTQRKGLTELLRALARTPLDLRDSWVLDLVGDGDQADQMRTLIADLGLESNVIWHGRVGYADTGRFYRDADVVVCPTLADYRSLGGFEAVNAGRILIGSVHDGAGEELARLAGAVCLVDPLDEAAFGEALTPYLSRSPWFQAQAAAALTPPAELSVESACDNLAAAIGDALVRRAKKR